MIFSITSTTWTSWTSGDSQLQFNSLLVLLLNRYKSGRNKGVGSLSCFLWGSFTKSEGISFHSPLFFRMCFENPWSILVQMLKWAILTPDQHNCMIPLQVQNCRAHFKCTIHKQMQESIKHVNTLIQLLPQRKQCKIFPFKQRHHSLVFSFARFYPDCLQEQSHRRSFRCLQ